jgi:hypothetical protein
MPLSPCRPWTHALDAQLRRMWAEGAAWGDIARILGRDRDEIVTRALVIRARPPPPDFTPTQDDLWREALPAGHPRTWGTLIAGTLLDGTEYPQPFFFS